MNKINLPNTDTYITIPVQIVFQSKVDLQFIHNSDSLSSELIYDMESSSICGPSKFTMYFRLIERGRWLKLTRFPPTEVLGCFGKISGEQKLLYHMMERFFVKFPQHKWSSSFDDTCFPAYIYTCLKSMSSLH